MRFKTTNVGVTKPIRGGKSDLSMLRKIFALPLSLPATMLLGLLILLHWPITR